MTEEELKIWFWDKFNSCYSIKHKDLPESIFMIYDPNFIRAKKLANILNKDFEYPIEVKGVCLFQLDYKYKWFNVDDKEIWDFFEKNYINNHLHIYNLINSWLKENNKYKILRPITEMLYQINIDFKNKDKLTILTNKI